ncbi:MAG TPA: extracellular solute-binding protein [Spirochaetota bacterium]|nr:extracellular solute-binding protein [Spirochaetota bacterium]
MFFMRNNFVKYIVLTAALSAVIGTTACRGNDDNAADSGGDEIISLDYTTHKLEEKLTWITSNSEAIIASPKAKKGGTLYQFIMSFPLTFRTVGPDSNTSTRSYFTGNQLALLDMHGENEKPLPSLATHWAYSKDGRTMYFKINPDARWSDGKPVTADDFIFTLEFMRSKHLQDPWYNDYYTQEIEKVTKYGDLLISVSATKKIPDLWVTVNLNPTPKHYYIKMKNSFVKDYNWAIEPNTGPYILKDFEKGKYLLFERKKDWWAKDLRYFKNRFNVDYFRLTVIRDQNVALEYFKKGELDAFGATRSLIWYEKGTGEIFDKGYVNKLWFYNDARRSTAGLFLNLDKEIFKDKNLRYAFGHAINWDKLNREIHRGEGARLDSYFSGYGAYTNTKLRAREFSIPKVEGYMKASGWSRGTDGIWTKNGSRFAVTISYGVDFLTPRLVILKEEAKKAGIELNLEQLDPSSSYKKVMEKKHEAAYLAWSTGFRPQPWEHFHSVNAHKPQTNNINNMDDPEMDKLIEKYRDSTDENERIRLSLQIQQRIHDSACWVPFEAFPFIRYFHWRWVKYPDTPGYKNTTEIFDDPQSGGYFWIDEDMKRDTLEAIKSGRTFKPELKIVTKYKKS